MVMLLILWKQNRLCSLMGILRHLFRYCFLWLWSEPVLWWVWHSWYECFDDLIEISDPLLKYFICFEISWTQPFSSGRQVNSNIISKQFISYTLFFHVQYISRIIYCLSKLVFCIYFPFKLMVLNFQEASFLGSWCLKVTLSFVKLVIPKQLIELHLCFCCQGYFEQVSE